MRRKIATLAVLVIAILATGGVLAARYELQRRAAPPPAPIPTVPVVAGVVSSQDVPIYLRGVGTVIAYNTVLVRSPDPGPDQQDRLHRRADRACG
jgi:multidrug efflux system membrane fusion protein